jgi:hypothetical protein
MLTILGLPAVVLAGLVIGWPGLIGQAGPWYQALSANPHLTATYIRLGTEPALRRRWRNAIYLLPLGLVAIVVGAPLLWGSAGLAALVTITIAWAYWHYARQAWGIARLYQRRAPATRADYYALGLAIHVPAVAAAIWWLSRAPDTLIGLPMYALPIPEPLAAGIVLAAPLAIVPLCWRAACQPVGARLDVGLALLSGGIFYLALVANSHAEAGYIAISAWHTVQYVAIVYVAQARIGASQGGLLAWSTARPPIYYGGVVVAAFLLLAVPFGLLLLAGVSEAMVAAARTTVWLVVTLHHYLLDTWIWQR